MSTSPLDAPARPSAPPPSSPADDRSDSTRVPRTRRRLLLGALALLVAIGGFAAVQQVRAADAAATAAEQRSARAELARDVETVRSAVAAPARDGHHAASGLLRHQLLVLAGDDPDPTVGERLVAGMQEAADQLDAAADTPMPQRPAVLPIATVDPVFDRLTGLEAQATEVAALLRETAEDATAWLAAVRDLDEAARAFADSTEQLPSDGDPDAIRAAWEAEGERLDAYADALERAADHPASAPLAEAHRGLVDGMRELSTEAVATLEDGDVDGYNALLADRLGGDDPFGFGSALDTSRAQVADAAIDGPLENARARALGLLTELEELRRATPAQLAELP